MDVKAMAKSKRSHTQHHTKKSYPKPTSKDPPAAKAQGSSGRASGKKVVATKPSQYRGAELPSNSDRYFDEDDSETMDGGASLHHATDVIKPKSKGADYRYLISEARSLTHSNEHMDVYSSLDDILPDLNQGFGDMLSVGGEAILSWTAADYFLVEDKGRPSYEASFLSLNLKTLNEQLANVDLAQRLFIEPDVLPPELQSNKSELKDDGTEPFENKAPKADPGTTAYVQPPVKDEPVLKEVVVTSSEAGENDDEMDETSLSGLELKSQVNDKFFADSSKKPSRFEASQAEAELDMLLDSLGETGAPLSSHLRSVQPQPITAIHTSKTASGLDDAIDGLLSSTSSMPKTASGLDEGIDDLLDGTSYMTIQDNSLNSGNVVTANVDVAKNSSSISKVKLVDEADFDSWLDKLV